MDLYNSLLFSLFLLKLFKIFFTIPDPELEKMHSNIDKFHTNKPVTELIEFISCQG